MSASKSYDLRFEDRNNYLFARVQSNSSSAIDARQYLKEIVEKCNETRSIRLMIKNGLPQSFLVWDMFAVATLFSHIGIECTKVAIIDMYAPIDKKEFSVVVGKKCGIDLQVFTDVDEAEDWLLDR